MDIKEAIYKIVLSNLRDDTIRNIYDHAIKLISNIESEISTMTVYINVYNYSSFSKYTKTKLTEAQFNVITGGNYFYMPLVVKGSRYSIYYWITNENGGEERLYHAVLDPSNLDIYNKLINYESEMLDGNS